MIQGLFEYGMVNTTPLRAFIKAYFDERGYNFKRKFSFLGVNAVNGNAETFTESLSDEDVLNGIMTSSAVPFAFMTQHWKYDGS